MKHSDTQNATQPPPYDVGGTKANITYAMTRVNRLYLTQA